MVGALAPALDEETGVDDNHPKGGEGMRRVGIGLLVALVLGAALIAATARSSATAGTAGAKADNITIWVGWSAAELKAFKGVVAEYDNKHSDVTVKVVGGINDDKITAAIRSGKVPDVVSSFTSANVGTYCGSGGWIDLAPLMKKSNISADLFPKTDRKSTRLNSSHTVTSYA